MSIQIARLMYRYMLVYACLGTIRAAAEPGFPRRAMLNQDRDFKSTIELLRRAAAAARPPNFRANLLYEPRPTEELVRIQDRLVSQGGRAVPTLLPILDDPDLRISEATADILHRIRDPKAQEAVIAYSTHHDRSFQPIVTARSTSS